MKTNIKPLLFAGILVSILFISLILSSVTGKIPSNDISTTGNTAGNLNNGGLFCELDNKVYFANSYDNGCLYSMNADETEFTKLTTSKVSSINAAGKHLYYFMNSDAGGTGLGYILRTFGIYRSTLSGTHTECLVKDACVTMQLCGDYIYYQRYNNKDFTKFHKVKTDKSEDIRVSDLIINPAACHNGIIYYNGQATDHYLYALDTRTDESSVIYEGNLWYPAYHEGYIYFMDVAENYRLCRYSLTEQTTEVLTNDRVDTFNVGNSYIYYQKNDSVSPALMRMRLDGSSPELIAEGNYTNIHITSRYVYFNEFGNETTTYHTSAEGAVAVSEFSAALEATLQ